MQETMHRVSQRSAEHEQDTATQPLVQHAHKTLGEVYASLTGKQYHTEFSWGCTGTRGQATRNLQCDEPDTQIHELREGQ